MKLSWDKNALTIKLWPTKVMGFEFTDNTTKEKQFKIYKYTLAYSFLSHSWVWINDNKLFTHS